MNKKIWIIIIAAVLVGALFLFKPAAQSAYSTASLYTCSDSDGGNNYAVAGLAKVVWNADGSVSTSSLDQCAAGKLLEWNCDPNWQNLDSSKQALIYSTTVSCPSGTSCVNGACITPGATPPASPCTDYDGGFNLNVKSYARAVYGGTVATMGDSCLGPMVAGQRLPPVATSGPYILEATCQANGEPLGQVYSCACNNGVCTGSETPTPVTTPVTTPGVTTPSVMTYPSDVTLPGTQVNTGSCQLWEKQTGTGCETNMIFLYIAGGIVLLLLLKKK